MTKALAALHIGYKVYHFGITTIISYSHPNHKENVFIKKKMEKTSHTMHKEI